MGDHVLGGSIFGNFINASHASEAADTSGSKVAEGANALRDLVYCRKELRVLLLESGVQREESGSTIIPVAKVCFAQEGVAVRNHLAEGVNDLSSRCILTREDTKTLARFESQTAFPYCTDLGKF